MTKIRVIMLNKAIRSINIISMSMSQTNIAMKNRNIAISESLIKIINQHNQHVNVSNEYNNQACIQWYQELLMCNQEIGTPHWSTHQMPHLPHLKFKLDPLDSPVESPFGGPRILAQCVPTRRRDSFFICLVKFWFLNDKKKTQSRHLFLFYFLKRKQNKKEKP